MTQTLACILLIDDHPADNFYRTLILKELGIGKHIIAVESAQEALAYLKQVENQESMKPDLMILDLKMPGMSGWEFLDEYRSLSIAQHEPIPIYFLTTSSDPKDLERARTIKEISGFYHKTVSKTMKETFAKDLTEIVASIAQK